jgi:sulfonate transport system substrate-binding protein
MKKMMMSTLLAGALIGSALAQSVTVRLGFAEISPGNRPFTGSGSLSMAHTMGYLQREFKDDPNIKIEFSFYANGAVINEAVAGDQIDLALQGDLPWVTGRANGLKTKVISGVDTRQNVYLAVRPEVANNIKTISDLKNYKASVFRGTNMHLAVARLLEANNLKERDLKLINMNWDTATVAIATGDIQATFGQAEFLDMEKKGLVKIVWDSKKNPNFVRSAHLIVTEKFEKSNPQIVQRVVNAVVRAGKWASEEANRDAVMDALSKTGRPRQGYVDDFEGTTMNFRMSPLLDDWLKARYRSTSKQAFELGLIRTEVNTDAGFESKYLERALKEQGLDGFWVRYDQNGKPM